MGRIGAIPAEADPKIFARVSVDYPLAELDEKPEFVLINVESEITMETPDDWQPGAADKKADPALIQILHQTPTSGKAN